MLDPNFLFFLYFLLQVMGSLTTQSCKASMCESFFISFNHLFIHSQIVFKDLSHIRHRLVLDMQLGMRHIWFQPLWRTMG